MKRILLAFSFALLACDTTAPLPIYLGNEYFPMDTTLIKEYRIDQIEYFANDQPADTTTYFIREVIADLSIHKDTTKTIVHRYRRLFGEEWSLDSVWQAQQNNRMTILIKGAVAFQKMAYPVSDGTSWDGNAFNHIEEEIWSYTDIHQAYEVNNFFFDSTVSVIQSNLIDPLEITENNYKIEVYAKQIGLIYKEIDQVTFCGAFDCSGEVVFGRRFKQALIKYE